MDIMEPDMKSSAARQDVPSRAPGEAKAWSPPTVRVLPVGTTTLSGPLQTQGESKLFGNEATRS